MNKSTKLLNFIVLFATLIIQTYAASNPPSTASSMTYIMSLIQY